MNDVTRTLLFVVGAAMLAGAATYSQYGNQPGNSEEFELVGKPFFEGFTSSDQAKSLEVISIDSESGIARQFSVAETEDLWTIPSHYNYPAEAVERLARTASSVMGINRESMAGRLESEHERLGVIDPLDENLEDPDSAGQRITIKDGDSEVLVDLIIGNEVEDGTPIDPNEDLESIRATPIKSYYVRRADEQQTYKVALDIDLSTSFSDWIDPDLLQVDRNGISRILVNNYKLEERVTAAGMAFERTQADEISLTVSEKGGWDLEGLDAAKEKVNAVKINEILDVVDELKIVGVRPKFKYKNHLLLTSDLTLNEQPEFAENKQEFALAIREMQADLQQKGFSLARGQTGGMALVSRNGDLKIGSDDGVFYTLHVGAAYEGAEGAIEVGGARNKDDSKAEPASDEDGEAEKATVESKEAMDGLQDADALNRYMMVRVSFEEGLVADRPSKPVEPITPFKPDGYVPAPEKKVEVEVDDVAAPDGVDAPPVEQERKPEFAAYDQAMASYEQKMIEYNLAVAKYEEGMKEFGLLVEKGKKRVEELNQRFGDWYYVISGENLKSLQIKRELLVERVITPPSENEAPARPDISFPNIPGLENGLKNPLEGPTDEEIEKIEAAMKAASDKEAIDKKTMEVNGADKPVKKDSSMESESKPKTDVQKQGAEKQGAEKKDVEKKDVEKKDVEKKDVEKKDVEKKNVEKEDG